MSKRPLYKSDAMEAIHQTLSEMCEAGAVDRQTMHEFDEVCLTAVQEFTPGEIRRLREQSQVSQEIFANYFNVSKASISRWERGTKKPSGPSLKLLSLVAQKGLPAIA
ncbi:helix-turn-helix domain-containing protein [Candidatus Magnetaquicoccus inordinatus]|uniref:helix-turn-helix domain-containing protein n=1 Tax=Candidatus Magnetaquicoccus inordinatus TaxID=2496818 RepID=UPI00102AFF6D|nr:DNA-binding transcriptional regulator [Candidatus Magnetaquicoccus inordinatus]